MTPLQTKDYPYTPFGQIAIRTTTSNLITLNVATPDNKILPVAVGTTYKKITGFNQEYGRGSTIYQDGIKVHQDGIYRIGYWTSLRHSANTATTGIVVGLRRNDQLYSTTETPILALMPNVDDAGLITGEGFLPMLAGDSVELYIASDKTGTVNIEACLVTAILTSPY